MGLSAGRVRLPPASVHRRSVVGRGRVGDVRLHLLRSSVRRPGRGEHLTGRVVGEYRFDTVLVLRRAGRPREGGILGKPSLTKVFSRTPGARMLKRGVGASADT